MAGFFSGGALDQNEFRSKINQSEMKNSDRSESVDSLKSITQQNYAIANGHEPHLMKVFHFFLYA